jgi:hypothetical protein
MALPSITDVSKLTFSLTGAPWCRLTAKSSIDLSTLTYSLDGSPWATSCIASAGISLMVFLGTTRITRIYHASTPVTAFHIAPP